jgi:5-methylcytosine-specific restriction endonuclease McrA
VQSPDKPHVEHARVTVEPLSAGSFALTATVSRETHDKLQYAKELLGHALPSGKFADVLDRALDALIAKLEQKKFGVTSRSQVGGRKSVSPRYIPMALRRAIQARDGGRCTFESESGRRCAATTRLEFDHETPVARGGESTLANLRLRCRAHNQYAAEQAYGKEFMRGKREQARPKRASARHQATDHEACAKDRARGASGHDAGNEPGHDVLPYLHALGIRGDDAREAAARCVAIPDATLEERVKFALASRATRFIRQPAEGGHQRGAAS